MSALDHIMSARIVDARVDHSAWCTNENTHSGSVDNILRYYYMATPEQVQAGYDWYADANAYAHTLSTLGGITLSQACDIIAANSINTPWHRNVVLAWEHVINRRMIGTLDRTLSAVQRVLSGERLRDIVGKDARKVRSFSANIEGDLDIATIDRWAYRIWVDMACCIDCDLIGKANAHHCGKVPNGRLYERVASDYATAAAAVRVPVAVLQAITWIVLRGSAD